MKCVFYLLGNSGKILCGQEAPFMYQGSSYCKVHIMSVLNGFTWKDIRRSDLTADEIAPMMRKIG